jgi:hypothetical protein
MVFGYIDKAWIAYKKNFWQIIIAIILQFLITAVPIIIGLLPWIFILPFSKITDLKTLILSNLGILSFSIVMFIAGCLVSVLLNGGFIRMLYEALRGKTKFETMLVTAKERFWTILGANLIVLLVLLSIIFAFLLVPIAVLTGFSVTSLSQSILLPYLIVIFSIIVLGVIVSVLFSIFFVFVNQAVVINNLNAVQSVKKSFDVSKKNYISILALFLIFFFFNAGLTNILSLLGSVLIWFLTAPLLLLSYTAFYVDKIKKTR